MPPAPPAHKIILTHLEWNIRRLQEILQNAKTDYYRDAALQRFGYAFDLAYKSIATFAEREGKSCENPAQGFELASQMGWLGEASDWQAVVRDHDLMMGAAKNQSADPIYEKLRDYCGFFEKLYRRLSEIQ